MFNPSLLTLTIKFAFDLVDRGIHLGFIKEPPLQKFDWPFLSELNEENCWVKVAAAIPWEVLSEPYLVNFANSTLGRPAKPARLVIGASDHYAQIGFVGP